MSHIYQLALPPLFPLLARDFEVSYAALGLLVSVFSVAAVLGQVPMGFVVDRMRRGGKVLIGGLLGPGGGDRRDRGGAVLFDSAACRCRRRPRAFGLSPGRLRDPVPRRAPEKRLGARLHFPFFQRQYRNCRRTDGDGGSRRILGLAGGLPSYRARRDRGLRWCWSHSAACCGGEEAENRGATPVTTGSDAGTSLRAGMALTSFGPRSSPLLPVLRHPQHRFRRRPRLCALGARRDVRGPPSPPRTAR